MEKHANFLLKIVKVSKRETQNIFFKVLYNILQTDMLQIYELLG